VSTVAVILAADTGEGFSSPKYLTSIDGVPMVRRVVLDSLEWNVHGRVVVIGPDDELVADAISDLSVTVIVDPEWEEGASSPLRAALDHIMRDRQVSNCVIARADQPGVSARVVDALVERAHETHADAVVPKYRYARGWPVVIGHGLLERLLGLEGDFQLHDVISTHASAIEEYHFDELGKQILDSADQVMHRRR